MSINTQHNGDDDDDDENDDDDDNNNDNSNNNNNNTRRISTIRRANREHCINMLNNGKRKLHEDI
jgi:hypothetical protein